MSKNKKSRHHALILVEGETEVEFYKRIAQLNFPAVSKTIINLKGTYNINKKIIDRCAAFSIASKGDTFDVYICVDRERENNPIYNNANVTAGINGLAGLLNKTDIIATLMIESLFFIDIAGIYAFLRAPKNSRNLKKYANYKNLTHRDMSKLFDQHGKQYYKGHKCSQFVERLDIDLIVKSSPELQLFVESVLSRDKGLN